MNKLNKEEEHIIQLINRDQSYANYFFSKVKSLNWFNYLSDKNYFKPTKIKFDDKGNAYFWNVFDYLERVSEQVEQNPQYGKELLNIIEDIVQFSREEKELIIITFGGIA